MEAPLAEAPAEAEAAASTPAATQPAAPARLDNILTHVAASVGGDVACAPSDAGAAPPQLPAASVPPAPAHPPASATAEVSKVKVKSGRTPHADSLAPNTAGIKRGSRVFPHLPHEKNRQGARPDKPLEVRPLRTVAARRACAPSPASRQPLMRASAQVRIRTTIHSLRDIDLERQTFTCKFFLEGA